MTAATIQAARKGGLLPSATCACGCGLLAAVGYLRLSDSRIEGELDTRLKALHAEAARLGWHLAEVIMERDETRRNSGVSAFRQVRIAHPDGSVELRVVRPGFDQLVNGLASGRYQRVLTEDMSRLLRRGRDNERLLDAAWLAGADVLSLSGTINLHAGGSDAEIQMARIMASMAEQFSRDMTRRVTAGRERHAGLSWGGGRRPYGFQPDPAAPKHAKRLVIVPEEAAVIRQAAADVLAGISLMAVTRGLRERGVPTVTGQPWETRSLRGVLTNGAVAGKAVRKGQIIGDYPWPGILDEQTWQAVRDVLLDPARRTHAGSGNEPRWLLSLFATCSVCGGRLKVGGAGRGRSPAYVGADCGHVRRRAADVDALITKAVLAWLDRYADSDRLRPAPAPDDQHAKAVRGQLAKLRKERKALLQHFAGDPDALAIVRAKDGQIEQLAGQLAAASSQPDPIAEFRAGTPAEQAWDTLALPRRRAVVQAIIDHVVILPAGRQGGRSFDPRTVDWDYTAIAGQIGRTA